MTTKPNENLFNSVFYENHDMYNEHTKYFSNADTEMNKALACLNTIKAIPFVTAPDWPIRDELVRALLTMVIEYPWPELRPQRTESELYDFMQRQRDSFKLGLLKYAPLYLAASAPVELIDGEIAEQMDYICNIAKEVIDIARNLSFIHGDLHTVYAHTIYTGYNA